MSNEASNKGTITQSEEITHILDKQERKRLRRKRIDKRNNEDITLIEEVQEVKSGTTRTSSNQISESLFHLDRRKHRGLQDVTAIRVAVDELEASRRIEDEELRKERLGKLQEEALSSAKANAAVEMKWAELLEKEIPQELYSEIQIQMAACNEIIKSKDDLISEFQRQLRAKDEEYVRTLRQQAEDIEELLTRVRREFRELHAEYEKEIDAIEEALLEEREKLIVENTSEIDSMFEIRKNKELFYKESKQKREEQYQKEIDDLIAKGSDQYNKLKIELELNIQTLKQQLEEIKATYQLNTEKLDYNYRVLTELDIEKNAELTRYKRRLNKLKDQLNTLTTKYAEVEAIDTKLNNELTEDYRSLTQKYKDLQSKFRHFEIADTGKYDEVWAMHEEVVKDLLDQLLKADKILTEQQLGWMWRPPDMNALQNVLGKYGNLGINTASPSTGDLNALGSSHRETVENTENSTEENNIQKVSGARVRAVLKILSSEAGFLVNQDIQESIRNLPDEDAELSKAEALLRALGVKNEDRLRSLISYFFTDTASGALFMDGVDEDNTDHELLLHNAPEDVIELKNMIRAEHVIAAVKSYMEDISIEGPAALRSAVSGTRTVGKSNNDDNRIGQKRLNSMKNYWNQLAQVVSDDNTNSWKQLEIDYQTLKELLKQRQSAVIEVDELNKRNVELKRLLNQYLGDNVTNDSFKVPPSQIMRVRNIPAAISLK